ncbi:glycosyltransferase family 4 protein [Candidatus Woesearchaeota archaeon]|nr:glycosyltransferase family 4 protein [Candidatus Woesearchaeota archaeon]
MAKILIKKPMAIKVGIFPKEYFFWGNFNKNKILNKIKWNLNKLIIKTILLFSDAIIADNKLIAKSLRKYKKNIHVYFSTPYGINMNKFKKINSTKEKIKLRKKYNIPLNKKVGLFIGRISGEKAGVLPLIKSIPIINKSIDDFFLLLIGKKNNDLWPTRECEKLIETNKLKNVSLRDQVTYDEVAEIMKACDLYIQPSLAEGHGMAPLEAMSCEIPVIATNSGGLKLNVKEDQTGFVIKYPLNPEEYASKIIKALKIKKIKKNNLLNKAHKFVENNYEENLIKNKLIGIFKEIAK